ncbi:MAG TPA: hypothetical protein VKU19_22955 [Bryobacteraceae bacterium]|nr:hypothetical protein [Bryobacteraceae bacterium]
MTATVNAETPCGAPGPTGTVAFLEGTTTLAALPLPGVLPPTLTDGTSNTILLNENAVSVTVARSAGVHTFTVHYAGDQFHQAANSAPLQVTFQ